MLVARWSRRVRGVRRSLAGAARAGWSGRYGEFPEPGKDFGEQVVAGWGPEAELTGVVDQAGGNADEPVAKSGDHGLAAADTVPCQGFPTAAEGPGEFMEPGGHVHGQQRCVHPGGVDFLVAAGQMTECGPVLAVPEDVLDRGPLPIPVLNRDRFTGVDTSILVQTNG